jgi:hypothetical protein
MKAVKDTPHHQKIPPLSLTAPEAVDGIGLSEAQTTVQHRVGRASPVCVRGRDRHTQGERRQAIETAFWRKRHRQFRTGGCARDLGAFYVETHR